MRFPQQVIDNNAEHMPDSGSSPVGYARMQRRRPQELYGEGILPAATAKKGPNATANKTRISWKASAVAVGAARFVALVVCRRSVARCELYGKDRQG